MSIVNDWVQRNYISKGLSPISSERELIGIASQLETENAQLRKEIEYYKADLAKCEMEAMQFAKRAGDLRRELQQKQHQLNLLGGND